jgi:hypothetical protein
MNHGDIKTALRTRLAATPSAPPIVWGENSPGVYDAGALKYVTPAPPYWLAYFTHTPPERFGLSKSSQIVIRLFVAVFVQEGTFEDEADEQAQRIIDQFPIDLILSAGSGQIQVADMGDPQAGSVDGGMFRTNVSIRCRAIFQRTP